MDKPVLPPRFWQDLSEAGVEVVSSEVVESWFALCWPLYDAYAEEALERGVKKINHKLRIAQWWRRARPDEIEAARERLRTRERAAQDAQLSELAARMKAEPCGGDAEKGRPLLKLVQKRAGGGQG
jgi:hypothetical protein